MFKTIVLAQDGSEAAQRAADSAAELAERDTAKLIVVHVHEGVIGKGGGDLRADEEEIVAGIRKQAEDFSAKGLDVDVQTREATLGGPAHAIAELADEVGADLIVLGTRGHSPVSGLLLGSVTQRLLHLVRCPVLAVPPAS